MRKRRLVRFAGCLIVLLLGTTALLQRCTCLESMQREPELRVQALLNKQLQALPVNWKLSGAHIWTDTDFTLARWAVWSGFDYQGERDSILEEIHVFINPCRAQAMANPSPASSAAGEGYIPSGWVYRPPHADRFEFGCKGGDGISEPDFCKLVMRYEEYTIVLSAPIRDYMTLEDLQRLLQVTDGEMSIHLLNSALRRGPRIVPTTLSE